MEKPSIQIQGSEPESGYLGALNIISALRAADKEDESDYDYEEPLYTADPGQHLASHQTLIN